MFTEMFTDLLLLAIAISVIFYLLRISTRRGQQAEKFSRRPKNLWSALSAGQDPTISTGDVLAELVAGALSDAKQRERKITDAELSKLPATKDVITALKRSVNSKVKIIAEVKRSSPSKGALAQISDPVALAQQYQVAGANVISVLTESRRFNGSIEDLVKIRQVIDLPILRKDFIATEFQVKETKLIGADLLLLIVAALDFSKLRDLNQLANEIGLHVLIEVHNNAELEIAMKLNPKIIGVNARNLKNLAVDESNFAELIPRIPDQIIRIAESGISNRDQVARLEQLGTDAILVGESLVKAGNPAQKIFELLGQK
jgi:indole-3-glycerol phosphate synthase